MLARALRLRETIYRLMMSRITEQAPAIGDMTTLNDELALAFTRRKLAHTSAGFAWQ